jgi:oligopeptide transport system ATP-binding protein
MPEPILQAVDLVKHYPLRRGVFRRAAGAVHAVNGVSLDVHPGEVLGIVGESGSGKSTLARLLMALEPPSSGHVLYRGRDLHAMSGRELRSVRRRMQIVLQDPYGSLDPRLDVEAIVGEPYAIHRGIVGRRERRRRVQQLLEQVGLDPNWLRRYPFEFSGGQRQRIGIARALALEPEVLICDEPVSALDVSIQAQVINLLQDLQQQLTLSCIFIAHDLSVVQHVSDRVAVMYLGRVIETGGEAEVYEQASHPYTQALISAVPSPDPETRRAAHIVLAGEIPSATDPPSGCVFRTRCWKAQRICAEQVPALEERGGLRHPSACHFADVADPVWLASRAGAA